MDSYEYDDFDPEDESIDYDDLSEMAEDYGYGRPVMQRMDDCNYDFDNYGYAAD